ncbi:hypothetical protein QE439_001740 [Pedobacter agri]|nr:hypothetical protein [Pedobacter agri]
MLNIRNKRQENAVKKYSKPLNFINLHNANEKEYPK